MHFEDRNAHSSMQMIYPSMPIPALTAVPQFLQRGRIAGNAERCISHSNFVCPSVRLLRAGTLPSRIKTGLCSLHCEVAKTLQFFDTNDGWGRRPLPLKICALSDPPPLKSADFDQCLLITSKLKELAKKLIIVNRKSTTRFPTSNR